MKYILLACLVFSQTVIADCQCTPLPCKPPIPLLLDGTKQPKFVNPLVNVLDDDLIYKPCKKCFYTISRVPFVADLGIVDSKGSPLLTPLFGYASCHQPPTFPGRTFVVNEQLPISVFWQNKLINPKTNQPLPLLTYVPVDKTIHLAMPLNPPYPKSGVPTVVHLHGGFTEYQSDGYPEAWATPNFAQVGLFLTKEVFTYSNNQEPTMLWYHDHTLGYTRLNNYAGLIGLYIIRGALEKALIKENKIPKGPYEIPLVLQDRMFTADGQAYFPYCDPLLFPCEPQPSVLPEFFGDFITVNGKAWPVLCVEPREYRLRVLNGADSRFFNLTFVKQNTSFSIPFFQIGTDQGLLNKPVQISTLLIAPAQRADLVVDFSCFNGETVILKNSANAPYPVGDPVNPDSTALVMAFKVTKPLNRVYSPTKLPKYLRKKPIERLEPTAPPRQLLLFETVDAFCRTLPLLGTAKLGALHWDDPVTETPLLGTTEIWEFYNTTTDAHPIHLHAGAFQILDRQNFTATQDPVTGALTDIKLIGKPIPLTPVESEGLFDTVIVYPASSKKALGQRTRIVMPFNLPGNYVWHCHIVSHEDHDMMRPFVVHEHS